MFNPEKTINKILGKKERILKQNNLAEFKIVWFSFTVNELMRESFNEFIKLLKLYSTKLELYSKGPKVSYIKMETDNKSWKNAKLQYKLSYWVMYHPINLLSKKPNISDYDLVEEL